MTQDVEKPLLSDYQELNDEKLDISEPARYVQSPAPRQSCALNTAPANHPDRNLKFEKFEKFVRKIATPISRKSAGFGCEAFVPLPINQECQKAARILQSFSYNLNRIDGIPSAENAPQGDVSPPELSSHPTHIVTIPPCVIANAVGLIVFTTGRLGFGHMSGSTGSGLLLVRRDSGEWGTPIPIQAYSLGGGPLAFGAEVSDRVYVLNNASALELFKNARFEIGPEVVLAAGPYGGGGGVTFSGMSSHIKEDQNRAPQQVQPTQCSCGRHQGSFQGLRDSLAQPIYCYMRSRGLYAGLQAEGTVFVQHPDQSVPENDAAVLINALNEAAGLSQ